MLYPTGVTRTKMIRCRNAATGALANLDGATFPTLDRYVDGVADAPVGLSWTNPSAGLYYFSYEVPETVVDVVEYISGTIAGNPAKIDGAGEDPYLLLEYRTAIFNTNLGISVVASGSAAPSFVAINDPLEMFVGCSLEVTFEAEGIDLTGWEAAIFTLKRDPEGEEDIESLILVRVSNPGGGDDGLRRLNGVGPPDPTLATLSVTAESPDATFLLDIEPAGTLIEPAPSARPHTYELAVYFEGRKTIIARGIMVATRPVLRDTDVPDFGV